MDKCQTIRVNPTTETVDTQHELETKRMSKKREIWTKQYDQYRKLFYGTAQEKEVIKKEHRQALLDQVKQREESRKIDWCGKGNEDLKTSSQMPASSSLDNKPSATKSEYLKQFRDQNKKLMEKRAHEQRQKRDEENRKEQELLRHDPINWRKTLV